MTGLGNDSWTSGVTEAERAELIALLMQAEREAAREKPRLTQMRERGAVRLSFAQQRLWVLDQLRPGGSEYNVPLVYRLRGTLEPAALQASFAEVVRRHEALRTRIAIVDGNPLQVVDAARDIRLTIADVSGWPAEKRETEANRRAAEIIRETFDLKADALLRVALVKLSDNDHLLVIVAHHIVSDGWSMGILVQEVGALYGAYLEGKPSPLSDLAIQYGDYAVWEQKRLTREVLDQQLRYWKMQLAGAPTALEFPTDRVRPAIQSYEGKRHLFVLSRDVWTGLNGLAKSEGATLFMVLLAALQVLLARWSGQEDIVVGTPIAGRTDQATEPLIGFFTNTLALRTDLSGDPSFRDLVKRVKEVALGAYEHQLLPFEKLVEALRPERDLSRQPVFQALFALQNMPWEGFRLPGLELTPVFLETEAAKLDLSLYLYEGPKGIGGIFEYATALFDASTIGRLAEHFRTLLEGIVADADVRLSELPVLSEVERHQLLAEWNATNAEYPSAFCLHELFIAQAAKTPDTIAVVCDDAQLTYEELDRQSNQLAHHLRMRGVGPEVVVGLCVERSAAMIIGVLGILKAGGAYLPLDPSYPRERLRYMLADARCAVVVTQNSLGEVLGRIEAETVYLDSDWERIAREPASKCRSGVDPQNLAYVIYTSGSTGRPKGVMVAHTSIVNFICSMARAPGFLPSDVIVAATPLSFDIAALELYLPLSVGAHVVVASVEESRDGRLLGERIDAVRATVLQATPMTWRLLFESTWRGHIPKALCGGDVLPTDVAELLTTTSSEAWNLYGPTETTVWSTASRLQKTGAASIGRPIANTRVYVLDRSMKLVPVGAQGDLYIGGLGVSRGYRGRPGLTADRFVPSPFAAGERLYRTGDLVRWRGEGILEFVCRADHQVKIRGFRIEPAEIEATLLGQGSLKQAAVVVREDSQGEKRLIAYVVAKSEGQADWSELRNYIKARLPEYMLPSAIVPLDALPVTANGKIDRSALPSSAAGMERHDYVAPRTPHEKVLLEIWSEVLKIDRIGIYDDFFELGGHSLLAMRLLARTREALGVDLPLRTLFENPTIAAISTVILPEDWEEEVVDIVAKELEAN